MPVPVNLNVDARSERPNWRVPTRTRAEPTPTGVPPAIQKVQTRMDTLRYVICQLLSVMSGIERGTEIPQNFDETRRQLKTVASMMEDLFPGLDNIIRMQDPNTPQKKPKRRASKRVISRLRDPKPYLDDAKRAVGRLRGKIRCLSQSAPVNYLDELDLALQRLIAAAQAVKTVKVLTPFVQQLPW